MSTLLHFPTTGRGAQRPAVAPDIEIRPQVLARCTGWQSAIAQECRRQRTLNPGVFDFLKASGLLPLCTFLATVEPGGPLTFRYIGTPTLTTLGRAWGRAMLNQPDVADPHAEFAASIGAQYGAAIDAGELLLNGIAVRGIGRPFAYTHLLVGWADRCRRAVLSAVDIEPRGNA